MIFSRESNFYIFGKIQFVIFLIFLSQNGSKLDIKFEKILFCYPPLGFSPYRLNEYTNTIKFNRKLLVGNQIVLLPFVHSYYGIPTWNSSLRTCFSCKAHSVFLLSLPNKLTNLKSNFRHRCT